MNLSTLPMEMIANIAKYFDHVELLQLRKTSSLVDTIAKRYGIGRRIPVQECYFDFEAARVHLFLLKHVSRSYNLQNGEEKHGGQVFTLHSTTWKQLVPMLDKIEMDLFGIVHCELSETTRRTLQKYAASFRRCNYIEFYYVKFHCQQHDLLKFLRCFPKVDQLFCVGGHNEEYILNYEFLSSRKWKLVRIQPWYQLKCPQLDFKVLELIVANNTTLKLDKIHPGFTVEGVARALTALSSGKGNVGDSRWGSLKSDEMEPEEAVEIFRTIPGISLECSEHYEVKVTFERDPSMIVQFCFIMQNEE